MEAAEHFEALLRPARAGERRDAQHGAHDPPRATWRRRHWPPAFRAPWLELLGARGPRGQPTPTAARSTRVRADLDAFAGELALDELPERFWPVAGALLVNLRNVLASLDVVADAQPVQVPAPALAAAQPERAVEVEGGADQRQVGERLREVAERLAGRADLLGVEPEVVGVGEHLLEGQPRLVEPPGARERLDVPERADRERALVAAQAVGRGLDVVAVDQRVGDELVADRVERRQPARVAAAR